MSARVPGQDPRRSASDPTTASAGAGRRPQSRSAPGDHRRKILVGEVGLKQIERSLVRRLDHRGIVVGRADQPSPRDLSSDEHLVRLRCILIGELKATVERQDATRLLRVDVVGPPPVIHHLRDPLVAEVLQQEVEECRRRVGRHHADQRMPPRASRSPARSPPSNRGTRRCRRATPGSE